MPNIKNEPTANSNDLTDLNDEQIEVSQEELESLFIAASEALAEAEEDFAEAQEESTGAQIEVEARTKDLEEARRLYKESPSDDTRYQYSQARLAKEEADDRLDAAVKVEERCKEGCENAMKAAIVAEIRRDYSDLKPQTDALQRLEAKHAKLSGEVAQLKENREENQENKKRTGYLDKQISVKEEKLAALEQKIVDKKEQITQTVDVILDKCEASANQRVQQKESKPQSEPEPKPELQQNNQMLARQHPSRQEMQKYEANLRSQLNKVEVEKGMLKKVLGNMSPYAKVHDVRNLQKAIGRLEKNMNHLKHEIGHVQKVLKGEIQHHVGPIHSQGHHAKNQQHQPNIAIPEQEQSLAQLQQPQPARKAASPKTSEETPTGPQKSEKIDRFIELGPILEKDHMEKVKSGEDIEENLGSGAEVVTMVIELAVARNLAIKQGWDINKEAPAQESLAPDNQSVTPKHRADLDIRETRSMHSEVAYGVAKRKSTGGGASATDASGVVAPVMPALPTSTKLK
ncbi:MAG: hypothetical protein AB7I18_01540 [Candidatus Berkiella sp.]